MIEIEAIPDAQLQADLDDSLEDIIVCGTCLSVGVLFHRDGYSVAERLRINQQIVKKIEAELHRRKNLLANSADS